MEDAAELKRFLVAATIVNFCLSVYFGGDMTEWIAAVYVMGSFMLMLITLVLCYQQPH